MHVGIDFLRSVVIASSVLSSLDSSESNLSLVPRHEIIKRFERLSFECESGRYQGHKFFYRLYVPAHLSESAKYPLILWLHGAGESGTDDERHLVHIGRALTLFVSKHGAFPGFVLAPQALKSDGWFKAGKTSKDDMLTIAWDMVQRTTEVYPIDKNRIVVAGVSAGGDASWEMGIRRPNQFAAIAAISSRGCAESDVGRLVNVPIWAFNNVSDSEAPFPEVQKAIVAVRAAGGRAKVTEISNVGHAAWVQALYENCDLLEWLVARHRSESHWNNYFQFVNWQRIGLQCGLPVSAVLICVYWICRQYFVLRKVARLDSASIDSSAESPVPL